MHLGVIQVNKAVKNDTSYHQPKRTHETWISLGVTSNTGMSVEVDGLEGIEPGALYNMEYPSETHHKLKSREISLVYNYKHLLHCWEILHRARRWYCRAPCNIL